MSQEERECVSERESEREREREGDRQTDRKREREREREIQSTSPVVKVREKDKERGGERKSVCIPVASRMSHDFDNHVMYMYMYMSYLTHAHRTEHKTNR
jgi:hypothetical protein